MHSFYIIEGKAWKDIVMNDEVNTTKEEVKTIYTSYWYSNLTKLQFTSTRPWWKLHDVCVSSSTMQKHENISQTNYITELSILNRLVTQKLPRNYQNPETSLVKTQLNKINLKFKNLVFTRAPSPAMNEFT